MLILPVGWVPFGFPKIKELRKGFFRVWVVVVVVVLGGGGRWSAKSPNPGGGAEKKVQQILPLRNRFRLSDGTFNMVKITFYCQNLRSNHHVF